MFPSTILSATCRTFWLSTFFNADFKETLIWVGWNVTNFFGKKSWNKTQIVIKHTISQRTNYQKTQIVPHKTKSYKTKNCDKTKIVKKINLKTRKTIVTKSLLWRRKEHAMWLIINCERHFFLLKLFQGNTK